MTPSLLPLRFVSVTDKSSLLSLEFIGHSSVEEYDADAGEPGACLDYADRWHVHRETMDRFDQAFTPLVEEISGIKRGADSRATERRKAQSPNPDRISPIREGFRIYISRVFAQIPDEKKKEIQEKGLALSRMMRISAAPCERNAPIEPMYYKRADSLLEASLDIIDQKCQKYFSLVPDFELARDGNGKPLRDSLARLLQRFEAARFAQED